MRKSQALGRGDGDFRWTVVRPVAHFAVIGLIALTVVALATAAASRRIGQREAITDARAATMVRAQGVVEPVVTDALATGNPAAVAAVGRVVARRVVSSSLVRVKIWNAAGMIVYSNDHHLDGENFALPADEVEALRGGSIEADISDLSRPENRDERSFGKLLEVYVPIQSPNGTRFLFEAYYRYGAVAASGRRVWRSFAPVSLGALAILELLQVPVAWRLARRLRQRQRERETLLRRALEASDVERRRVASDLHDGVVQDLAGLAFTLAGAARGGGLPRGPAAILEHAATAVRSSITALRGTLVDIYPPDLAAGGLRAALTDLAANTSTSALSIGSELSALPDQLPDPVASLLYRVAREALRNVGRHAQASTGVVRAGVDGPAAWVEVSDDGVGFDSRILDSRAAAGHLGLKGMHGVVRDTGGFLRVESTPGWGTTVRASVPLR